MLCRGFSYVFCRDNNIRSFWLHLSSIWNDSSENPRQFLHGCGRSIRSGNDGSRRIYDSFRLGLPKHSQWAMRKSNTRDRWRRNETSIGAVQHPLWLSLWISNWYLEIRIIHGKVRSCQVVSFWKKWITTHLLKIRNGAWGKCHVSKSTMKRLKRVGMGHWVQRRSDGVLVGATYWILTEPKKYWPWRRSWFILPDWMTVDEVFIINKVLTAVY